MPGFNKLKAPGRTKYERDGADGTGSVVVDRKEGNGNMEHTANPKWYVGFSEKKKNRQGSVYLLDAGAGATVDEYNLFPIYCTDKCVSR